MAVTLFIFKDIDVISTLSFSKCHVLKKSLFDLYARMTFSKSEI
jgi:hypothetical protein